MGTVKRLPVLHHNADCIFISFGITRPIVVSLKMAINFTFIKLARTPMQLQTVKLYKQKENRKQSGHPLKKMTTMLASQQENRKQSGQPCSGLPQC